MVRLQHLNETNNAEQGPLPLVNDADGSDSDIATGADFLRPVAATALRETRSMSAAYQEEY